MDKPTITIGEDEDGFLGYDSAAIAQIDIEASKTAYETIIEAEIKKLYPNLEVEFAWGGNSDYSFLMETNPDYAELQSDLEEIEDRIYNLQSFWVLK